MSSFLFINQYAWPDEAATAQLLADLTMDLVRAGHEATILCGRAHYAGAQKPVAGLESFRGVRIRRMDGSNFGRHTIGGRFWDAASFSLAARRALAGMPRYDAVVAMSSPPLVGLLALPSCRARATPIVLWTHDIYPEIAEKLGTLRSPPLRRWLRARARRLDKASARIIVPGEDMRQLLNARPEAAGKVRVVPNWVDLDEIACHPVHGNPLRQEFGWHGQRVLMYSGNLGAAHDTDTAADLIVRLETGLPDFRFALVGDSTRHRDFARRLRERGVRRLQEIPFQPRARLGDLLGAADAHLVMQKPEVDGLLVPSKFYGAVAAGRPLLFIGSATCEIGGLVAASRLGAIIPPGAADAGLEAALRTLRLIREEPGEADRLRAWAVKNAGRTRRTGEIRRILEEVVACP